MSKDTSIKIEPLLKWIWRSYLYTALVPLLLMTGVLIAIYLMAGKLARDENIDAMRQVADDELLRTARRETVVLQKQLESVAKDTRILAKATEHAGQDWITSRVAPVYNGDFLEEGVGLDIPVEMLVQKILGLQIPWDGYPILVGKNGTILALPPAGERALGLTELKENHYPEAILKDSFKPDGFNLYKRADDLSRLAEQMQNLPSGLGKLALHGKPQLAAWSTVPETGWKLLFLVSEEKIYAQAIKLDQRLKQWGAFLVGGLILVYAAFFIVLSLRTRQMSHFLASPLITIKALAERIGSGDYHQVPPRFPVQELNDMARQLAAMGDQLGENHSTLLRTRESLNRERALLRSLIDAIPDLIFYKNTAGVYLSCNKAFADSLARRPAEIVNKTDSELFPEELAARLQEKDQQVFAAGKPRRDEESLERPGGRHTVVETLRTPFLSQQGEVLGLIGISRDIEQRKRGEAALENAKQAAEAASRAKTEFLARMSHEIRTPLNGVLGMAELLQATPLNAQQQRFTSTILSSGRTLLATLSKILDFSKIETGRLELEVVPFDVRELVEDTAALLARAAQEKGLDLISDLPMNLPASVQSDPVHLRQILVNLVDNAIKFTSRGEVIIRLRVSAQDSEAPWLRFEVRDTGVGIAPAAQVHIFDSFTQADGSTGRHGGTGLGLAISRQLVHLMGGEIGVDSTPGVGSRFWFTVPLQQSVVSTRPFWLARTVLRGLRVLIVDDNATQREILHLQVATWGMVNDKAENGVQALALLREALRGGERYDLAIVDRQMPVMDGLELARQIRATPGLEALKLVMLTASELDAEAKQAVQVGIQATLHKPVRQAELYKTLCRLLDRGDGSVSQRPALPAIDSPRLAGRVLVAEDNPVNQEVALAMLTQLGCQAGLVANGREAVEALTRTRYDLILMDCQMPVLDGFAATEEIRRQEQASRQPAVPIIALTANVIKGFREQCLAAGMNDYLSKPFSQAQLKELLERWLPGGGAGPERQSYPLSQGT